MSNHTLPAAEPRAILEDIAESITGRLPESNVQNWPIVGGKPIEYGPAGLVEEIVGELVARMERFGKLMDFRIQCLYRNKETWEKQGKTVMGECKLASGLLGYFSDADFVLLINLDMWKRMNPWQRVALVYHELRHAGINDKGKPAIVPHDAEVFLDEIPLFGVDTYLDWKALAAAAEAGSSVQTQFHLEFGSSFAPPAAKAEPEDDPEADEEQAEQDAEEPVGSAAE